MASWRRLPLDGLVEQVLRAERGTRGQLLSRPSWRRLATGDLSSPLHSILRNRARAGRRGTVLDWLRLCTAAQCFPGFVSPPSLTCEWPSRTDAVLVPCTSRAMISDPRCIPLGSSAHGTHLGLIDLARQVRRASAVRVVGNHHAPVCVLDARLGQGRFSASERKGRQVSARREQ